MTGASSTESDEPAREQEQELTLKLLQALENEPAASQRSLSRDLGVALGTVNWHLKRCVRKGYIKVQDVPLKRYAYYLTPTGFEEKSRLTLEYIRTSLKLFRQARRDFSQLFGEIADAGHAKAVVVGRGELAEAAVLSAADSPISLVGIQDFDSGPGRFAGLPVYGSVSAAREGLGDDVTAFVLADLEAPAEAHGRLLEEQSRNGLSPDSLFAPRLLGLDRRQV